MENSAKEDVKFGIHRIYVKDVSFESPGAPEIFQTPWKPNVNIELEIRSKALEDGVFEVALEITVTAKTAEDKTGFLIEIEQAGIFTVKGMEESARKRMLGAYCPNLLFPYARETIDTLAAKGSFPPLMIAPVNFEQLYQQSLARENAEE